MSVLFELSFPVAVPRKWRDVLDGREKPDSNSVAIEFYRVEILSFFSPWEGVFHLRAHNTNVLLR